MLIIKIIVPFFKLIPLILLIFSINSCQPITIRYFGKFEKPTEYVQVYFTTPNLKENYQIIGIAMVNDTENVLSQEVLNKIIQKAKNVGANAIAINWHSMPAAWYNPAVWDQYYRGYGAPPSSWGGETYFVHHRVNNYMLNITVTFLRKTNKNMHTIRTNTVNKNLL
ncbi:MAG TPA: hypothetical protein QF753_14120 [Victivallales bacterium]|nr:hypothetical protein [Victivallales bacterium]